MPSYPRTSLHNFKPSGTYIRVLLIPIPQNIANASTNISSEVENESPSNLLISYIDEQNIHTFVLSLIGEVEFKKIMILNKPVSHQ